MTLRSEILEQPAVAARLLARADDIAAVAAEVRRHEVEHVVIAARGTSDHAAIYAQYLFGVRLGLPVALATPSVLSLYGAEPRFGRALVLGISQSGASPDIVGVVGAARRQGVPTIALTNEPSSALAGAADHLIDLGTGPELAVAATKTYTAELLALAILGAALGGDGDPLAADPALAGVTAALEESLATEGEAASIAAELAPRDACVVVGRGFEYATAREWARKLKELAHVVVLSDRADLRALGRRSIPLPAGLPEHLGPIASIVPGQLLALHLTQARGLDPENPRNIAKVTETH